ncbi:hypothetical protein [Sneathiella limimaris]|uniref:hypothetical protein n=1 Tax=Sneathiella limimaris TaxID=1964213 RepID=UPI00146E150F|nr:hypothetical protein [Sneathiella limimaris]
MQRTGRKKEWAILVFCLFLLGIFPPLIKVFDLPDLIFSYPLSFLYLFGFWALMILFVAIGARRRQPEPTTPVVLPTPSNDTLDQQSEKLDVQ